MAENLTQSSQVEVDKVSAGTGVLPRSMGLFATFVFAISAIGLATSGLQPFSIMAGKFPGVPLAGMVGVGFVVCLVHAYNYAVIGTAVQRSGSDYFLTTRVLSPVIGFAASLMMLFFGSIVMGTVLAQIGQTSLPIFLRAISILGNVPAMIQSVDFLSSPQGISITGSVGVFIAFLAAILPLRINQRILQVGFVLILASWLVVFVQLLFPQAPFAQSWDRFMGVGTYAMQVPSATTAGMQPLTGPFAWLYGGLLFAFWIFFGFQSTAYLAGEVKKPGRNLILGSLAALLVVGAVVVCAILLLQRILPGDWISAQSFLYQSGKPASPWIFLYAAILRPNPILLAVLTVTEVFAILNIAQAYLTFLSRILSAWCEDNLLPRSIGFVHPQLHSPIVAVLIVAILAQVGVWVVANGGMGLVTPYGFIFFAVICQVIPLAALFVMPWVKKDWLAGREPFARFRIGPLPVASLSSLLMLVYCGWIVLYGLQTYTYWYQTINGLILFAAIFALAVFYFLLRRSYLRGEGKNLGEVYLSFPDGDTE